MRTPTSKTAADCYFGPCSSLTSWTRRVNTYISLIKWDMMVSGLFNKPSLSSQSPLTIHVRLDNHFLFPHCISVIVGLVNSFWGAMTFFVTVLKGINNPHGEETNTNTDKFNGHRRQSNTTDGEETTGPCTVRTHGTNGSTYGGSDQDRGETGHWTTRQQDTGEESQRAEREREQGRCDCTGDNEINNKRAGNQTETWSGTQDNETKQVHTKQNVTPKHTNTRKWPETVQHSSWKTKKSKV